MRRLQNLNEKLIGLEKNMELDMKRNGSRENRLQHYDSKDMDLRSKRKMNELDPRDPRYKRAVANQEENPEAKSRKVVLKNETVKVERASPSDFLFRETRTQKTPTQDEQHTKPHANSPSQNKSRIHPYQEDTFDEQDPVEPVPPKPKTQSTLSLNERESRHYNGYPVDDIAQSALERPPSYHQPYPTHPSELVIRPEEIDFRIAPYEPRPFAQHFVIPAQGFLCKICDRFFCTSDEAHIRHCSSMEHYDNVCRRIAPPPPRHHHPDFRRPDVDPYELRGRREFVMANLDNYKTLAYGELKDNLLRRGLDIDGDRNRLTAELEKLLRVEETFPDAAGYYLVDVEENDIASRKYKWFAEFQLRQIISELPGVISVVESNKRSLDCTNGKRFLWTISILMDKYFPDTGMKIEESKVVDFQRSEMHVKLARRLLNLKAFKRDQKISVKEKNYIEI